MSTAVRVENISKRYIIKHKSHASYPTMRDFMYEKATAIFKKKNNITANTTEDFWALRDVSFEINKGDKVGIIGKNGAGKSTLLKILSRITEPTNGKISIKGRVASLLEVGTGFHPELTGRENIFLNGAILGMRKAEIASRFDEIVAFSGVEKFLDTPVKRYSSGMYVRLAFAVAAHLETEILIVDEVLAVGDADFQKKCLGKMQDVSKQDGRTILFVSHNMGAINSICNNAILLKGGSVQQMGDTETITGLYFSGDDAGKGEFVIGKGSMNEKVIIEKITLRDAMGNVQSNFQFAGNIEVEAELNSLYDIDKPYIWIAIKSYRGPITAASGLIDGYRPGSFSKGKNVIKCTFLNVPLLPGQYILSMGIRSGDGNSLITDTKDIGVFNITTILNGTSLNHALADRISADSLSPIIPYQWEFNDGKKYTFDIKTYIK